MLAIVFDIAIAYLVTRKVARWVFLVPLALVLGAANSLFSSWLLLAVSPDTVTAGDAAARGVGGILVHAIFILICMGLIRLNDRRSKKD
jgi:hypothetical protein